MLGPLGLSSEKPLPLGMGYVTEQSEIVEKDDGEAFIEKIFG